jgi:AcrR family transcriptional regulator
LFSQFGVDKVSMMDIARKAGVSQATIYNNFDSKDALAREFVATAVEQLVKRAQDILTPERQFREKMAAFLQMISAMMVNGRPSAAESAVFSSGTDLQNDPEIKQIRMEAQGKMIQLLLGLIQEGKQQGQVDPDLSDEAMSIYFVVFMDVFINPQLQPQLYHHPGLV